MQSTAIDIRSARSSSIKGVSTTISVRDWDALMNEVASEAAQAIVPSAKAGHALERDLEIALVVPWQHEAARR